MVSQVAFSAVAFCECSYYPLGGAPNTVLIVFLCVLVAFGICGSPALHPLSLPWLNCTLVYTAREWLWMVTLGASNILTHLQVRAQESLRVSFLDCRFRLIQIHARWWLDSGFRAQYYMQTLWRTYWLLDRCVGISTGRGRGSPGKFSKFVIYAKLADDRTQNWFHSQNIDGLQYQYRFVDEVNVSSMWINDSNLT